MKTAPFVLEPSPGSGCRGAVLLLHGFTGSPWEVRLLGESLADRGYFVDAPRLPGHGTTPEAMAAAGLADWVGAAEGAFDRLSTRHGEVSVVGLSMGALLGVVVAARRGRVRGLVLMAPVVRLRSPGARLLRAVRWTGLPALLPAWIEKRKTDLDLDEARAASPVLPRYPLARVMDLFDLQDLAMELALEVRCPSLLLAAASDHVVDVRGVQALGRRLRRSRLVVLQRGFHIIPRDRDRAVAATETAEFLDAVAPGASDQASAGDEKPRPAAPEATEVAARAAPADRR
jgi:carboxylesterase